MATILGTANNDSWTVVQAGTFTLDGLGGVDTLNLGTSKQSDYVIAQLSDGAVTVDSVSGASASLHAKLYNIEKLVFNTGRNSIDLSTYFGDTSAPTLLSSTPANGASKVAVSANLVLNFSENIKFGSGTIQLQTASGELVETYSAGSSAVSIAGSTVTINPSADLAPGSGYKLVIGAAALSDGAGNAFAGVTESFTTLAANHAPTGTVTISGTPQTGQTLTALTTVADADGLGLLNYQWLADGTTINGATTSTLQLGASQAGAAITVQLSYTDGAGYQEKLLSPASARVSGVYMGTSGNDVLTNSAGNDLIDGAAGVDKVVYHANRASYTLAATSTGYTLTDQTGAEGVDTLSNIERLQFADTMLALDVSGIGGQAYRLYQAAFNRTPDSGGLGFWIYQMDKGMSLNEVAGNFVTSKEFIDMYGSNLSNADFIDKLYHNVLHRAGEDGGVAYWLNYMNNAGGTQAQVLAYFGESLENVTTLAATIGQGFTYTPYG
ncbi:DUF4214 domain-containing protein [Pseudoduganella danionis]|uniref:DUF4214 domain-containing protein n=1 Tax=Pseudoduganella danionis TaxID=1890295 RepID=A0ABW9SRA7_9BURK|nr:DUF4214 domain-containing protein [Pseudoduganella danionis]MTW34698.1 DUF4214 domain-containing protein [Pseudoduganella danionis]